jgi:altronate dehydratase small subunit
MKRAMQMTTTDSVATALEALDKNDTVSVVLPTQKVIDTLKIKQTIPLGHKLAVKSIAEGDRVTKYGESIGHSTKDIGPGEHVHIHNVMSDRMQLPEIWYRT